MTPTPHDPIAQISALALCFSGAGGDVPEWVQITPPGPRLTARDGRSWSLGDPTRVVAAFEAALARGDGVPVDFEHATHIKGARGEPAPAVGWVTGLEVRDGALWARIDWNETGRLAVARREYRYVSPGFHFHRVTREVRGLVSVGLTNQPAFLLTALNRKETPMDPDVLTALGLAEGASPADAVAAIDALKTQTALARATPDPGQFVPRADHELALNRLGALEADLKSRREAEIAAAVDGAIEAGKIAPAAREYHLATCRTEGGLDRFRAHVGTLPVIAGEPAPKPKTASPVGALSADELAVCRQMGIVPAEFAAARAAEKE